VPEMAKAVVLGLIQGLTEFLPVSSSGHLVIATHLLGKEAARPVADGPEWVVCLHLATAAATLLVLRGEVRTLARGFAAGAAQVLHGGKVREVWRERPDFAEAGLLVLAGVPAGVVGLLLRRPLEALTASPAPAGGALLVTGGLLWLTRIRRPVEEGRRMTLSMALLMGLAQAAALVPGLSRSGATLSCGLLGGWRSRDAVRFSFLMAVLPILAAAGLKATEIEAAGSPVPLSALAVGFLVALGGGYLALRWLIGVVRHHHLHRFAWYCWAVGGAAILWGLSHRP